MKSKVLIIEHHETMRAILNSMLLQAGCDIISAETAAQGLVLSKKEHPTHLFVDVNLENVDISDFIAHIRVLIPHIHVTIILDPGDIGPAGMLHRGADEYILKPFSMNDILLAIQKSSRNRSDEAWQKRYAKFLSRPLLQYIIMGVLVLEIALFAGLWHPYRKQSEIFPVPYSNPTAMVFDGKYVWVTDWVTQQFYQHVIDEKLTVVQSYYMPESHMTGIAFDGTHLYSSNAWEGRIYRHQLDNKLTIDTVYVSPGPEPTGLFWDSDSLWICDSGQQRIYKTIISTDSVRIVTAFPSPGPDPAAIFKKDKYYYIADSSTNLIYRVGDDFKLIASYAIPYFQKKGWHLSSVCSDGVSLWACSDQTPELYKGALNLLTLQAP